MFVKLKNFLKSPKFWINIVAIIVFWVVTIWAALTYFKSYTNFGERIAVPVLLMNNINDVPSLLAGSSLRYEVMDSVYNPNLIEGTVIYQDPLPTDTSGLHVKTGRLIKLRVSKQSRLVEVPVLISRSERFAEGALNSRGFRTKITYVPSKEDQGSVIEQKVKGRPVKKGLKMPINSLVELVVGEKSGEEMTLLPNLVGLTINEAENRLKSSSTLRFFAVYANCENQRDSLNAIVTGQSPVAHQDSTMVPEGTTVTVFAEKN